MIYRLSTVRTYDSDLFVSSSVEVHPCLLSLRLQYPDANSPKYGEMQDIDMRPRHDALLPSGAPGRIQQPDLSFVLSNRVR